jgi:hypothetical protein
MKLETSSCSLSDFERALAFYRYTTSKEILLSNENYNYWKGTTVSSSNEPPVQNETKLSFFKLNKLHGFTNCRIEQTLMGLNINKDNVSEPFVQTVIDFLKWRDGDISRRVQRLSDSFKQYQECLKANAMLESLDFEQPNEVEIKTTIESAEIKCQCSKDEEIEKLRIENMKLIQEHKLERENVILIGEKYREINNQYKLLVKVVAENDKRISEMNSININLNKRNKELASENALLTREIQGVTFNTNFINDLKQLFGINDMYALMQHIRRLKK